MMPVNILVYSRRMTEKEPAMLGKQGCGGTVAGKGVARASHVWRPPSLVGVVASTAVDSTEASR